MKTVYERWKEEIDEGKKISDDIFERECDLLKRKFGLPDECFETTRYVAAKQKLWEAASAIGATHAAIAARVIIENCSDEEFEKFIDEAMEKGCELRLILVATMMRSGGNIFG